MASLCSASRGRFSSSYCFKLRRVTTTFDLDIRSSLIELAKVISGKLNVDSADVFSRREASLFLEWERSMVFVLATTQARFVRASPWCRSDILASRSIMA